MNLRRLTPLVLAVALAAVSCGDEAPTDPQTVPVGDAAAAKGQAGPPGELSQDAQEIAETIESLFPSPGLRNAALTQLGNIDRQKSRGELEDARTKTLELVAFVAGHEEEGNLLDPPGPTTTEEATTELINELFAFGGVEVPDLSDGALSEDGAVALVQPDEETTVTNGVEEAGVMVPAGTFDVPTLVVIEPIEESGAPGDGAGPLPTSLDQYPLFFDISASSEPTGEFVVGLCVVDPPDPFAPPPGVEDRLRLAHPDPDNAQTVEILELATATFLDCSQASTASLSATDRLLDGLGALATRVLGVAPLEANPGGLGGLARSFSPFGAVDTLGGFVDVATGDRHSCAVTGTGDLFCWGDNAEGQLGDGTTSPSTVPVAVASADTFTAVEAGGAHTCALTVDGDALCWGANGLGQLGDGTTTGSSSPVAVSGGITFTSLSAGLRHTCGINQMDLAYCWGVDDTEQVGAQTTETCTPGTSSLACSTSPLLAFQGLQSVSAGIFGTCGVTTADEGVCWGENVGQFGDGTSTGTEPSAVVAYDGITLDALEVGAAYSCGLEPGGDLSCSGLNTAGQLGDGSTTSSSDPVAVSGGLGFASVKLNAGNTIFAHSCGVTPSGDAYCWGANDAGQLGASSSETCSVSGGPSVACSTTPVAVSGGLSFSEVDPGGLGAFTSPSGGHTCGVTTDDVLYCWGANDLGQLGDGTTTSRSTPTLVTIPAPIP